MKYSNRRKYRDQLVVEEEIVIKKTTKKKKQNSLLQNLFNKFGKKSGDEGS